MKNLVSLLTRVKENEELTRDEIQALDKFITDIAPGDTFLKPLTFGHLLKATDGKFNRNKFKKGLYWLSEYIKKCSGDDKATLEMKFDRYCLQHEGTYLEMFDELVTTFSKNSNSLFFTKAQIKSIFKNNHELLLNDGTHNMFFYKNQESERFIFLMSHGGKGRGWAIVIAALDNASLEHSYKLDDYRGHILFIPQE